MIYDGKAYLALDNMRAQSLLAYLLLHCQAPQSRQHLAYTFWPDSTERQARNNLRKLLHQLRQKLPNADQFLQFDTHTVRWRHNAPYTLDVSEFERKLYQGADLSNEPILQQAAWEEAIALYGDDLLTGCYDEWIFQERERLRQAFIETLERLIWLTEDRRQFGRAIQHAQHLLRYDPLHEATYRRLMRLHAVSGDRTSALQTYHACVSILQRELGVEPGREIQQAYARLREMETPAILRTPSVQHVHTADHLVGRMDEWQALQLAWRRATQDRVHFCLIIGEAGIGKTRLAEEMIGWVTQQGIPTARTRAYAAIGALSYTPVIEWLRSEAIRSALEKLEPLWLTEVARLLPELLIIHPHLPHPDPWDSTGPGQWQRQRLFEALTRAVLADPQPKVLLIDDLQWCDGETLAWLQYLLHFVQVDGFADHSAPRLLIVCTVRPEEIDEDHPLTAMRFDLNHSNALTEIKLAPLGIQHTAELAVQTTQIAIEPETVRSLHLYTDGVPLFVVELMRTEGWRERIRNVEAREGNVEPSIGLSPLSPKVSAIFEFRLTQLSPAARELANLAAVIGCSFTFELLLRVSGFDRHELVQTLEELWKRHIVGAQDGRQYDFSHDRIREVTYAAISPIQRPLLHWQVAQALEQINADDIAVVSGQLAFHYEHAGELEHAIDYYEQAADKAHTLFADADAVNFLHCALKLIKRLPNRTYRKRELSILLKLYNPLLATRGFLAPELGEICTQASLLAQELGEQRELLQALSGLRSFHQMRGRYSKALVLAKQMLSLSDEAFDEDVPHLVTAHHALGNVLFFKGELRMAQEHFEQALAKQRTSPGLLIFSAMNSWLLGYPDRARQRMYQSLLVARAEGHPYNIGFATTNLARLNHFLRRSRLSRLWAQKTIGLCTAYDIPFWLNLAKLFLGWGWADTGETERSVDMLQSALTHLEEEGHQAFCSHFWSLLAEAYGCAHQFSHAMGALDHAASFVKRNGERFWEPELVRLRGEYLLAQEAPTSEIEECYLEAISIAQQLSAKSLELRATTSLVRLLRKHERRTEACTKLAHIYNWFTEGFTTPDLQDARAILKALS